MPSESSFDIVSKIDRQEADNALNQAAKEISNRFDFRGVGASIQWSGEDGVDIRANSEERASAVLDVFKEKLVKRGVSLKHLDAADPKVSGKEYRLRGKGVPHLNEHGRGDLVVQIVVQTPKKFTKVQRELLRQLGETMTVENTPTKRSLLGKMKDLFS